MQYLYPSTNQPSSITGSRQTAEQNQRQLVVVRDRPTDDDARPILESFDSKPRRIGDHTQNAGSKTRMIGRRCRKAAARRTRRMLEHAKQTTKGEILMSIYFDLFRIYTEHKSIHFLIDLSIFVLQPLDVSTPSSRELHFRVWQFRNACVSLLPRKTAKLRNSSISTGTSTVELRCEPEFLKRIGVLWDED